MIESLNITIWERIFELPVEYDCYDGEKVTRKQKKACEEFAKHLEWIDNSKQLVEEYCHDKLMQDSENEKKDNIFSYVKPDYFFVKREKNPRVILICKYRYDMEHGLAIMFSPNGEIVVDSQDNF